MMIIDAKQIQLAKLVNEALQKHNGKIRLIPPTYQAQCGCCDKIMDVHNSSSKSESLKIMFESLWTLSVWGWRCDLCNKAEVTPSVMFKATN